MYERFTFTYTIGDQEIFKHRYELLTDNFVYLKDVFKSYLENHRFIEYEFEEPDFIFKLDPARGRELIVTIDSYSWKGGEGYSGEGLSALMYLDDREIEDLIKQLDDFERPIEDEYINC
jgi:3-isopropylmalate dehydratase small subunit